MERISQLAEDDWRRDSARFQSPAVERSLALRDALQPVAERHGTKRAWLIQLLARRATKVAAVALANKTARMIWALMTSGERYREPTVAVA